MEKYPNLIDSNKLGPVADPYVIALARSCQENSPNAGKPIILTQEKNKPSRIPHVANYYGIDSMALLDFFANEEWSF